MKLNIGCWNRYIPGWIHIDQESLPHVDYVTKAHDLNMIASNSCEIVYASHVLEYYDWDEAENIVLPEWRRVLKVGGKLRVAVPDFEAITRLYQAGFDLRFFVGPLFGRMTFDDHKIYHKCVYDENTLKRLLINNDFISVHKYDWRETEHSDIDDHSQAYIPHMDKDKGVLISLNMEATKY